MALFLSPVWSLLAPLFGWEETTEYLLTCLSRPRLITAKTKAYFSNAIYIYTVTTLILDSPAQTTDTLILAEPRRLTVVPY